MTISQLVAEKTNNTNNVQNDATKTSVSLDKKKPESIELLGNVAAIALIMSYLQNKSPGVPFPKLNLSTSTTAFPYGVTDDMTPPHQDQLWATVYPLFQHFLNNRDFNFIPPPSQHQQNTHLPLSPELASLMTSKDPISFTEPPSYGTTAANTDYYTRFNHYVSYYPAVPTSSTPRSSPASQIPITRVPHHGATTTTQLIPRSEEIDEDDYYDSVNARPLNKKPKTLLLVKKIKKKKRKKKKLANAVLGAALIKKISKPLLHVVKKPSKYWLDLKFDIDFYDILKKKLLYFLAYTYMPVFMILAFGVLPLALSLVPLVYKMWWADKLKPYGHHYMAMKKREKFSVPYHPYPAPPPRKPPIPANPKYHLHRGPHHYPSPHYATADAHEVNNQNDAIDINSPPIVIDHHYAADTSGKLEESISPGPAPYQRRGPTSNIKMNTGYGDDNYSSLPYNIRFPKSHSPFPSNNQKDQEIHVHIHDDDEDNGYLPQNHFTLPPQVATYSPPQSPLMTYTSYTRPDLQPYPTTTDSYNLGFDIGQALSGLGNKHDIEILKILIENKKQKISNLLDMWNLAKYGAAVTSNSMINAVRGAIGSTPSTSIEEHSFAKRRKKKRRRRKRKPITGSNKIRKE